MAKKKQEFELRFDGTNTWTLRVPHDKTGTYGGFMYLTDEQYRVLANHIGLIESLNQIRHSRRKGKKT